MTEALAEAFDRIDDFLAVQAAGKPIHTARYSVDALQRLRHPK